MTDRPPHTFFLLPSVSPGVVDTNLLRGLIFPPPEFSVPDWPVICPDLIAPRGHRRIPSPPRGLYSVLHAFPSGCPSKGRDKRREEYDSNSIACLTNRKIVLLRNFFSLCLCQLFCIEDKRDEDPFFFFFFFVIDYSKLGYNFSLLFFESLSSLTHEVYDHKSIRTFFSLDHSLSLFRRRFIRVITTRGIFLKGGGLFGNATVNRC